MEDIEKIEIQKIKLYSSNKYVEEQEEFNKRKDEMEKILTEANIEYALEITEQRDPESAPKIPTTLYTLILVVKLYDFNRVKILLDDLYQYGYEVLKREEQDSILNNELEDEEAIKTESAKVIYKENINSINIIGKILIGFCTVIYAFLIIFEIALIFEAGLQPGIIIAILIETYIYLRAIKAI